MNYRACCVTVLGLLYKLWAPLSNCLFCTSLLQSAKGQQNRKQSPLKPQTAQNISLLLPLSLKTPSKHRKKKRSSVQRNQNDLLSLVSAYEVIYSHTLCCLMKLYTENSADLDQLVLKTYTVKYTYGGKSKNVIKVVYSVQGDIAPQLTKVSFLLFFSNYYFIIKICLVSV